MKYGYAAKDMEGAKAFGRDLGISFKQAIEISNYIRGNPLTVAKRKLEESASMKKAIPFKRFTNGLGHKPGIAAGRFAVNASTEILQLLKSAESNALFKGMNAKSLFVSHISVHRAPTTWHYGRQHRRKAKRCHVQLILNESSQKKDSKPESKTEAKIESKSEPKNKKE